MARSRCDREAFDIIDGLFGSGLLSLEGGMADTAAAESLLAVLGDPDAGHVLTSLPRGKLEVGQLVAATAALAQLRWQEGRLGFEQGVALFAGLERLLRQAEGVSPAVAGLRGRVLVVVPEGAGHLLGPRLLRRELGLAGVDAVLAAGEPVEGWLDRVAGAPFDVVGLSIGHDALLAEAAEWIARIRLASCHAGVRVMVGGAALTAARGAYGFLGADIVTNDIAAALSFVERAGRRPERAN